MKSPLGVPHDTLLLLLFLNLLNACAPLVVSHTWAANRFSLSLPHASVDINILDTNPHWTMRRKLEPAVDLPHKVQDDKERSRHIKFKEGLDLKVRSTEGVKGDVELRNECNSVDREAHPRAPDTERGSVWDFIESVTVHEPGYEISVQTKIYIVPWKAYHALRKRI
jgi:hypothetical protein